VAIQRKLLIVDDYDDSREMLAALLGAAYHIVQATNGLEALESARRDRPSVILMDISMPVMDGLTASRYLRADPILKDIPIIAHTAQPRLLAADQQLFFAVVRKPIDYRRLLRLIEVATQAHIS
jgi:two-component system cell cycle response regulator DivK